MTVSSFIDEYLQQPSSFVVPNQKTRQAAMDMVGVTYDAANYADKFGLFDDWAGVKESGFDADMQLWELVNVRNQSVFKYSADIMKELSGLLASVEFEEEEDESEENEAEDVSDLESEEDKMAIESGESEELGPSDKESEAGSKEPEEDSDESDEEDPIHKPSIVDDEFFSLAEMEKFCEEAEEEDREYRAILAGDYPKKSGDDEEESEEDSEDDIDIFQDLNDLDDDDEDEEEAAVGDLMYSDFFKAPRGSKRGKEKAVREKHAKRVKFDPSNVKGSSDDNDDDDDEEEKEDTATRKSNLFEDDDEEGGEQKSEFEKRQEKLQNLITKLEDEAVDRKHWALTGEVDSAARPKDSLLQEDLEFDQVQKPVPVATQESTQSLEDIIKQRILNQDWDDVERKRDIQTKPFRPSERFELNDKAPQKSLAEEYEGEYMAQRAGDEYVAEDDAKLATQHKEIDQQFRNLFVQLDALSNFHFTPKPATADVEIRTQTPALQMEEKLPVHVSQAEQLAPEEVYEKTKGQAGRTGDLMGDSEMSREDRKRMRQRKKEAFKKKTATKEAEKKVRAKVIEVGRG